MNLHHPLVTEGALSFFKNRHLMVSVGWDVVTCRTSETERQEAGEDHEREREKHLMRVRFEGRGELG